MTKQLLETELKKHHNDAYIWSYQCCNYNKENAKDVLQMAYLKIIEGKAVFKNKSSFKTWLFSVIRFTAYDFIKAEASFMPLDSLNIATEEPYQQDTTDYKSILKKLPARQQQVLLLAFYHDMTLAEIANITGLHLGTVRTHYERGKDSLRKHIVKITA